MHEKMKTEKLFPYSAQERLAHHDLVFRAPVNDPVYGLPIGNGNSGCLLWMTEDCLKIQINRNDLWDESDLVSESYCSMEDERLTTCRNGAVLTWDLSCPAFETIYQDKFRARLSLYDACAHIHATTPFIDADFTAFSSEAAQVTVLRGNLKYDDRTATSLKLERWGSRTFFFWYDHFTPNTNIGLGGTQSTVFPDEQTLVITQELKGRFFAVAVKIAADAGGIRFMRRGGHSSQADFPDNDSLFADVYIAIECGGSTSEAVDIALAKIRAAAETGFDTLLEEHQRSWEKFWTCSYISLNEDEHSDFLENLWYLNMYYAKSAKNGNSPEHFCNGPWGFYHDFVPWNHYFHYNMQLSTFPLEAAGHGELLETYYNFRYAQLPHAKQYAKEIKNTRGAFYPDVCDGLGRGDASSGVRNNCTCGAQIALGMYRHYQYSGDCDFLTNKALPVMKETAQMYLDLLKKDESGSYHIYETTTYEGSPLFDDSLTDIVMIRALFTALCDVLSADEAACYAEVLAHLPCYHTTHMDEDEIANGIFLRGIGKGMRAQGENVLCVGKKCGDGVWMRRTFGNPEKDYYGFPDIEMSPVFPAGEVGIRDRGSELYKCIYNDLCLHHPALPEDNPFGEKNDDGLCMGWCMTPIYLARMGMTELLHKYLRDTVSTWITYPQGFGQYGPYLNVAPDLNQRWHKHFLRNTVTGELTEIPMWKFRHFNNETLPIVATAINEMLMQSHDGTIRLFCAVEPDREVAFSLAAIHGFDVEAVYSCGSFRAIVTSRRGGELSIAFENICDTPVFQRESGESAQAVVENDIFRLEMEAGEKLSICAGEMIGYKKEYRLNDNRKKLGNAVLGCEKEFGI